MIQTARGEFDSLALLRHAYLDDHLGRPPVTKWFRRDEEGEWDDSLLHISDLGKCPRQTMLRIADTRRKPKSASASANDALMFWQGNMIHALTIGALDWGGILVSHEGALPNLADGWSGHYDAIYTLNGTEVCWDGKSVRPNNFLYWYEWPKAKDVWQMRGYLAHFDDVFEGQIEYIDRGGANTPQLFRVDTDPNLVSERMNDLALYRGSLPMLPPPLEPVYKATYRKVTNEPLHRINKILYGNSWECEWCDYLYSMQDKKTKEWTEIDEDAPCRPRLFSLEVATSVKGELRVDPRHEVEVEHFLAGTLKEWYDLESEDEGET